MAIPGPRGVVVDVGVSVDVVAPPAVFAVVVEEPAAPVVVVVVFDTGSAGEPSLEHAVTHTSETSRTSSRRAISGP